MNEIAKNGFATRRESKKQITPAVSSERSTVSTSTKTGRVESCVLPHHAVYKEDSLTTKQRIVFDASAETSNGRSLNDLLFVGPTLQNDLPAVLLNWRQYRHVFTADMRWNVPLHRRTSRRHAVPADLMAGGGWKHQGILSVNYIFRDRFCTIHRH